MKDNIDWQIKVGQIDRTIIAHRHCLVKHSCGHFEFILIGDKKNAHKFKEEIKYTRSQKCDICDDKYIHSYKAQAIFNILLDKTKGIFLVEVPEKDEIRYNFYLAKCESRDKTHH